MMITMDDLMSISAMSWHNAFQVMEAEADKRSKSMSGPYFYLGEIDDPSEMLCNPSVTLEMVQGVGKTNWLETLDGQFLTVNDATLDNLIDQNKIMHGHRESEPSVYDLLATVGAKIRYRMENQHIDENLAKELVFAEMDINPYRYTYLFELTEITDDPFEPESTRVVAVEANSLEEAENSLYQNARRIGEVIRHVFGKSGSYVVRLVSHSAKLVETTENYDWQEVVID